MAIWLIIRANSCFPSNRCSIFNSSLYTDKWNIIFFQINFCFTILISCMHMYHIDRNANGFDQRLNIHHNQSKLFISINNSGLLLFTTQSKINKSICISIKRTCFIALKFRIIFRWIPNFFLHMFSSTIIIKQLKFVHCSIDKLNLQLLTQSTFHRFHCFVTNSICTINNKFFGII